AAYSASKGGVVGLTLPVARDLSVIGVRVNCIAPGLIDTPIYGTGEASEAFKDKLKRDVLFPDRLGTADEFASLALEILTNSYMNAETIRIDGELVGGAEPVGEEHVALKLVLVRLARSGNPHQQLHECRDHSYRRRRPAAAQVGGLAVRRHHEFPRLAVGLDAPGRRS